MNDNIKQYVSNINGYYVKDSEAREKIDTLDESVESLNNEINKFNLSEHDDLTFTGTSEGTMVGQNVKIAYDPTHSVCKIYGRIVKNSSGEEWTSDTLTATLPFNTNKDFTINNIGNRFTYDLTISNVLGVYGFDCHIEDDTISITYTNDPETEGRHSFDFFASIIFLEDFGDNGGI